MVIDSTWPGFFLVIDGIDGSGKSTQTKLLAEYFTQHHIPCYLTTEPSSNDIGKLIRQYLKKTDAPAAVDALLFAADRVEHVSPDLTRIKEKENRDIGSIFGFLVSLSIDSRKRSRSFYGVD